MALPEFRVDLGDPRRLRAVLFPESLETESRQSGVSSARQEERVESFVVERLPGLGEGLGEFGELGAEERSQAELLGASEKAGAEHIAEDEDSNASRRSNPEPRQVPASHLKIVEIMAAGRLGCGDHGTLGIAVELVEQKDQGTFRVVCPIAVENLTSTEHAACRHSQGPCQVLQALFYGQLGRRSVDENDSRLRKL